MDIVERLEEHLRFNGKDQLSRDAKSAIERLREDLDLTQRVARAEIDAKIRYAWALSEITKLKPDEEFGAVPIEAAQRIASEALKWKE
jgi:hypothetical protein